MQRGTFGGTPAADSLDDILRKMDEPRVVAKIGRMINKFQDYLKHFRDIKNSAVHSYVLDLFVIDNSRLYPPGTFPILIQSHLNNYLTALVRKEKRKRKEKKGDKDGLQET